MRSSMFLAHAVRFYLSLVSFFKLFKSLISNQFSLKNDSPNKNAHMCYFSEHREPDRYGGAHVLFLHLWTITCVISPFTETL
jgi:hypothetical protein